MSEDIESIVIAVPIKVKIRRALTGYFLGPCFIYYASAMGVEEYGDSPERAAQNLGATLRKYVETGKCLSGLK